MPDTSELSPAARSLGLPGLLRVRAERVGDRTRIVDLEGHPPLQAMAAHELDPDVPDLATLTLVSPTGGILQGDRLDLSIDVGPGARLAVGTQSAVRVYRTPSTEATARTTLLVAPDGWLEHLPDPWLPYAGSRMRATTRCVVDVDGVLLVSESVMAGRLARGERFGLDRFESLLLVERPDGTLVARDCLRIDHDEPPMAVGRFGDAFVAGTLLVVASGVDAELLRRAVDPVWANGPGSGVQVGISGLADGAGAWLRVLGPDAGSVMRIIGVARAAVRETLLGVATRPDRRP